MKFKNIFPIVFKFWYVRKKRIFAIVIFSTVALYLSLLIYMEFIVDGMTKVNIEEAVKLPLEDTYKLKVIEERGDFEDSDKIKELISYVKKAEGMHSYGYYYISTNTFEELSKNTLYQRKVKEIYSNTDICYDLSGSEMLYIEPTADEICKIEVCQGSNDVSYKLENGMLPLLVGYSYKDVLSVGTILTESEYKTKYQVVGILKNNSNWLEVGDASFGYTNTCMSNLNGMMIAPFSKKQMEKDFFCFQSHYYFNLKGVNNQKIIESIEQKAKKLNLNIKIMSVKEQLDIMIKEENNPTFRLAFLIISSILIAVLLVSSVISYIVKHKGEYGILFASGLEVKSIGYMTFIENMLLILIPAILSYCWIYYQKSTTVTNEPFSAIYFQALTGSVTILYIINVVVLWGLTSIITCIYIAGLKPLELIRGLEE